MDSHLRVSCKDAYDQSFQRHNTHQTQASQTHGSECARINMDMRPSVFSSRTASQIQSKSTLWTSNRRLNTPCHHLRCKKHAHGSQSPVSRRIQIVMLAAPMQVRQATFAPHPIPGFLCSAIWSMAWQTRSSGSQTMKEVLKMNCYYPSRHGRGRRLMRWVMRCFMCDRRQGWLKLVLRLHSHAGKRKY